MRKRLHLIIKGHVQGVFFRVNIRERAIILGILGWVKNTKNHVEAVFEGEKERLEQMLEFCKEGPSASRVDDVEIKWENFKDEFEEFRII